MKGIMEMALELGGFEATPADSAIYVEGKDIKNVTSKGLSGSKPRAKLKR